MPPAMTTKRLNLPRRRGIPTAFALGTVAAFYVSSSVPAQQAPAPAPAPAPAEAEDDDSNTQTEVVVLSPFEVVSAQDTGYAATSSLAGSRLNTQLRDVASAIQVVTPEFLRDTGATD